VLHGPEIIDSGCALKLIEKLQRRGMVTAVLGGTMGRVALIDAGLQDAVQISPSRRPSQSIRGLEESSDIIFLLSLAKSRESGLFFGAMVGQAAGEGKPLIHIDWGGRFISLLRGDEEAAILAGRLALELGLDLIHPPSISETRREDDRGIVSRILYAVYPGEPISVNGTVIGRATDGRIEIKAKEGRIVQVKGVAVKQHGLEKLNYVDLEKAIIRSGSIRRTTAPGKRDAAESIDAHKKYVAAFIDHFAEDAFEAASGAGVAVTVGDDTTAIAGDILSRTGTIVMGIVDGDLDHLAEGTGMMLGSTIFRVDPGHDDVVGREVKDRIFQGKDRIRVTPAELAEKIKAIAGSHLLQIEQV
jgi:hypothetical protein